MKILCGYNVNLDSVYSIGGDEVSKLLESQDQDEILRKVQNPPGAIYSVSDFLEGLVLCMREGSGAEWLVYEKDVFDFLKENFFGNSLIRMGGNAGIMANVLSEMGAEQVVPNVTKASETQLSFFSKKAILIPPSRVSGSETVVENDELIHFVFDFKKGETFSFQGEVIIVPRENRFIATYDRANIELAVNPDFERFATEHIGEMDGALISGFHMLIETYPDGSTYVDKINRAAEQLANWKRMNSKLPIHVEMGHFLSRELAYAVFSKLSGVVECMGMNEDELVMLSRVHGVPSEGILQMEAPSIIKAAIASASSFNLTKLVVHTREFVVSVSSEIIADPVQELRAMEFGVKCAATFAATGRLDSREFVDETAATLKESTFGLQEVQKAVDFIHGKYHRHGASGIHNGYLVCILPTIICEDPIATVGLGDTVAAATFLRELELHIMHA
jgi:ADP-dependent phosphofructokinase/glucokinase